MTTLPLRKSIVRSPLRHGLLLIPLTLALTCFALSPTARAQLPSPTPDGGYPGNNTAEGDGALSSVQINPSFGNGIDNTAIGFNALFSNTTGGANTATGSEALFSSTTGFNNTATGDFALHSNTTGNDNTATGSGALDHNTTGGANTATGGDALVFNTTGTQNTATGGGALANNTHGRNNTATGSGALLNNQNGNNNIAVGTNAGVNLVSGNNNIDIGSPGGVAGESNHIRIGTVGTQTGTFIAGIHGVTVASAVGVVIDVNGHLGTVTSSARFKDQIKPMDKASEAILALKPVTFHYKHELDPDGIPQFGLIAEQVEKVSADLVARDADGKVNTVRYEAVNAMLLNEFLKEHQKVQRLEASLAAVNERLKAQDAKIDKVNAKVELTKPVPQVVLNNQ